MAAVARAFVLNARAKFNLRLEVGAAAPSGLHRLRSAVADLLVCDEVAFLPSDRGFSVSCDDPAIPEMANLAWSAARALEISLPDVAIHIRKGLPVQAGLGGGSADAAAALRGIAEILGEAGVKIGPETLFAAAARIGSDVPACLVEGLKIVDGTGEIVRPIPGPAPRWGVLLLKPPIGVPTADAYRLFDGSARPGGGDANALDDGIDLMCRAFVESDLRRACALIRNDLQAPVERAYPSIAEARLRLLAVGAAATTLCGSGSCVAGLFETIGEARDALARLRPDPTEWTAATGFADGR